MAKISHLATILVVEDENIIAKDLMHRLGQMGFGGSQIASSGEEAIKMATTSKPDLVLMDIGLKGSIDGIEAGRHIQEVLQIPVVFLSAYPRETTLHRASLKGPVDFIGKPFHDNDLYAILNKHFSAVRTYRK